LRRHAVDRTIGRIDVSAFSVLKAFDAIVEAEGHRFRFEDVAGRGRTIVGRSADPAAVLTAEQRRLWDLLDGACG
jgi:hypothetical protein